MLVTRSIENNFISLAGFIKATEFFITSKDPKWSKFGSGEWGQGRFEKALGLTKESLSLLRELVKSDLILKGKHAL